MWTVHVLLDGQADTHISPHTQKHSSEALALATMWMDPENMMFSERQTQKDTQDVISLMGNVQNRQVHRNRKRILVARGWKKGMGSDYLWAQGFLLG